MNQMLDKSDYITDKSQLADYFFMGCKNKSDFKIGVEFERIGVDSKTFHAIPYNGKSGVAEFIKRIKIPGECEEVYEGDNILGLQCSTGEITLEPGAQFEYSTKPFVNLEEHENAINEFNGRARRLSDDMGITWLGYGVQPLSTYSKINMIPKSRYEVMRNYLPQRGSKGLVMMMESAGVQASIDYGSEEDAMKKLRVALGISPLITAMFSNSPVREGKLSGYKSYRAMGWLDTDNDRCGLISQKIFEEDFGFDDYVEVLLDVPMFFVEKEGSLLPLKGMTFREYMNKYKATMRDWQLHLSTFFPDVRVKNLIEIRNCDSQSVGMAMAFAAMVKGILYNEGAMDAAWDLVKKLSWHERNELRHSVTKNGLSGIADIAKELVSIADYSLGEESLYLDKLKELLSQNKTPADVIIENWEGSWGKDLKKLIDHTRL